MSRASSARTCRAPGTASPPDPPRAGGLRAPAGRRPGAPPRPLAGRRGAVVVLLVGAGLFLFRGDPLTLGGRYVTEPADVLADADAALADYVAQRHGAAADSSRCWFELTDPDGHEVRDALLCGPVLFVDGDADAHLAALPAHPAGRRR